jgi:hypothetical protein
LLPRPIMDQYIIHIWKLTMWYMYNILSMYKYTHTYIHSYVYSCTDNVLI